MDEKLKNEYITLCIKKHQYTLDGDFRQNNKAMKRINEIYKIIENNVAEDGDFLIKQLDSKEVGVRLTSASHCLKLGIAVSKAIKTLKKISKNKKYGILSFDAEMVLRVYRGEILNRKL